MNSSILILIPLAITGHAETKEVTMRDIFQAIATVETGGESRPDEAVGAAGERGRYQIMPAYWQDAVESDPDLRGTPYERVTDPRVCEAIMVAYWRRYAKTWTAEEFCRLHNGGPSKRGTDRYWARCYQQLVKD